MQELFYIFIIACVFSGTYVFWKVSNCKKRDERWTIEECFDWIDKFTPYHPYDFSSCSYEATLSDSYVNLFVDFKNKNYIETKKCNGRIMIRDCIVRLNGGCCKGCMLLQYCTNKCDMLMEDGSCFNEVGSDDEIWIDEVDNEIDDYLNEK